MSSDINELVEAVRLSSVALDSCRKEESFASHNTTAALNRLNSAQNAVDKAIDELKSDAERDSNWGSSKVKRMPA